jgi:hypothetical protein
MLSKLKKLPPKKEPESKLKFKVKDLPENKLTDKLKMLPNWLTKELKK